MMTNIDNNNAQTNVQKDEQHSGKHILLFLLQKAFDSNLSSLEKKTEEHMLSLSSTTKTFSEFTSTLDKMSQETDETIRHKEEEERKRKEEEERKRKEEEKTKSAKIVRRENRSNTTRLKMLNGLTTPSKNDKLPKKENTKETIINSLPITKEKREEITGKVSHFNFEDKTLTQSKTERNLIQRVQKRRNTIVGNLTTSGKKVFNSKRKKTVKESIKGLNLTKEFDKVLFKTENDNPIKTEPTELFKQETETKEENEVQQEQILTQQKVIYIPLNPPEYYINNYHNEQWFNNIISYLPLKDQLSFVTTSKLFKRHYKQIINNLEQLLIDIINLPEGQTLEDKIKELQIKVGSSLDNTYPKFQMTKGAFKAVELCNGDAYTKLFANEVLESKLMDIVVVYKILFRLINEIQIAEIENDACFWTKCCEHINEKYPGYQIGTFIIEASKNIFIEDKQVYQIKKLIMQRKAKIVPAFYTKKCPTTGLIVFFIKDSLEYCGVFCSDKKTPPLRILNNLLYMKSLSDKVKLIKEHIETL